MQEGIHQKRVTAWLSEHVAGLTPPLTFSLVAGGHSNLTFRCEDSQGRAWILRRPPLGHVLESAHDMAREYRIITALAGSAVPVPETFALCEDAEVNDAPFYVMDFVEGIVLHDATQSESLTAQERRSIGEHVIDVLGALHQIDPDTVGLGDLGRKEAYLERQLKRWSRQWEATKTHEIPEMDKSLELLRVQLPQQIGSTIVHGDYRLGNMLVKQGRMLALLDWELCTLGDPLADVGYLLNSWLGPDELMAGEPTQAPTTVGGFPDREELCQRYQHATGRDLSDINYYRAFSHWRLAAIGQGVYKRYLMGAMGQNREMDLELYKESVSRRAAAALALLSS